MAKSDSVRMDLGLSTGESSEGASELKDQPFRILVLGDFSGRVNRNQLDPASVGTRARFQLDCDNVDQLPAELGAELQLPVQDGGDAPRLTLTFRELDDFHPDRLFESVEVFSHLRRLRRQLLNSETFGAAAREVSGWSQAGSAPKPEPPPKPAASAPPQPAPPAGSLLDAALAATEESAPADGARSSYAPSTGSPLVDQLIREVVGPYVVPAADPRQPELVASVDTAATKLMGRLLHHPAFQELEANWRSLQLLTRRLETDSQLQIHIVDMTKGELLADLDVPDVSTSGSYKLISRPASSSSTGGAPWSVIIGSYTFGPNLDDLRLLGRLAQVAHRAGAPFLAAAHSGLVGCDSFGATPDADDWQSSMSPDAEQAWGQLRNSADAAYAGLALPRFLLRAPFGKKTGATESFTFEEMSGSPQHEHFLWGNPAFLCACAVASRFRDEGDDGLRPDEASEFGNLPLYTFKDDDGESQILPGAEALLLDRAATKITDRGLIAVRSIRGSDAVRVSRLQSIAAGGASIALRGRR